MIGDRKKLRDLVPIIAADLYYVEAADIVALLDELDAKDARIEKLRIGLTAIADDKYGCARGLLKHVDMAREVLAADDEAAKG